MSGGGTCRGESVGGKGGGHEYGKAGCFSIAVVRGGGQGVNGKRMRALQAQMAARQGRIRGAGARDTWQQQRQTKAPKTTSSGGQRATFRSRPLPPSHRDQRMLAWRGLGLVGGRKSKGLVLPQGNNASPFDASMTMLMFALSALATTCSRPGPSLAPRHLYVLLDDVLLAVCVCGLRWD
jgi:hypothetical protein